MVYITRGKTLGANWLNEGGGGQSRMRFRNWLGMMRVGGNTISLISLYKNCDISPITKKSSSLVSHFPHFTCKLVLKHVIILV